MSGPSSRLRGEQHIRAHIARQDRDIRRSAEEDVLIGDTRRLILRSPNGHYWSVTVTDAGALATTDLGTEL